MNLSNLIRYVRALDSALTDGSGKTGLTYSGITAKSIVPGGTLTTLTTEDITTLGTYQAPSDSSHIRIKELNNVDPTKGVYEIHFHNTQILASNKKLWLFLSASNAAFQPLEIDLVPFLYNDNTIADRFAASAKGIGLVTVTTGSTTTVVKTSAIDPTPTDTDQFAGRVLVFLSDTTTTGLRAEASRISNVNFSTGDITLTDALSRAPASGDLAVIL